MHGLVETLFTYCSRVGITVPSIKVALVNSLSASFAVHILKVVHFDHFIFDRQRFSATKHVHISDLVDLLLALGAGVFHLFNPLLYAGEAIDVRALV